jgi:hypothetical protein
MLQHLKTVKEILVDALTAYQQALARLPGARVEQSVAPGRIEPANCD